RTAYRMSWLSMSTLHCWRKRHHTSARAPKARAIDGSVASSASHSARNSRRAAPGASRETIAMKRRGRSGMARAWTETRAVLDALAREGERVGARAGDLVVAPRRPLLAAGDPLALPVRADEAEGLEAPQRGIDGAGLQSRAVGDVEPVADAVGDRVQHQRGRIGDVAHWKSI